MTNLSHFKCFGTWLTPVLAAGLAWFSLQAAQAEPAVDRALTAKSASEQPELDPTVLKDRATTVMETYCISCHGPEKQKGDVRLDALAAIDPVDLQKLYATAKEMVHFAEMPPEKVDQPSEAERKILLHWLNSQLTGKAAKALAEKLLRFEYGNVVNHEDLFSGDYADLPAYSPDRRWMISEFIFNEKVNRLLNYSPMRTIAGVGQQVEGDSGIHWSPKSERGDKFRRSITNPFLLSEKSGVRYYVHDRLTTGHLLTMVGNAKRIAERMTSEGTIKAQYPAMYALTKAEFDDRELLRSREQFLTTYSYMGRLLKDIYKDQYKALLPALKHTEELYPGPPMRKNKIGKRQTNLGLIGRLDGQDVQAIYRGIAAYQAGDFEVEEIAPQGDDGYATYAKPSRNEYNSLILQSERDWIMEGVSDYRRTNRITIMKLFYDQWHLPAIYKHVAGNDYGMPQYTPRSDAEMAVIVETIKTHRRQGDTYRKIIENCMADWQASLGAKRKAAAGASDALLGDLVIELYNTVHERVPTAAELADNLALMKSYTDKLEMQQAIAKLVESLVLNTDFAYRHEFGVGEADTHGRRMMSPRDASYALAYALTDSSPDAELTQAASAGKLSTRQDYEREVRRMLRRRDQWTIIDEAVQAANINSSVTNQPIRKLRFFRDFFGYPKAMKVFKDDHRFGAGRHEPAVSRLIDEADLLVEYILEQDKKVFEELLTTDSFYVYHSGDNTIMQAASDRLKAYYDHFKEFNWEEWEAAELFPHKAFIQQFKVLGGENITSAEDDAKENKSAVTRFKRQMTNLEQRFGNGQKNAAPFNTHSRGFWHDSNVLGRTGQHMRGEQVATYWNIDWRTWDYPAQQPAKIPNRKGILTHPAWLIAHAQNLETDPIHRGKWIREKLLAGTIPDVPITVDAVIPEDHSKTMRQRMENRTGDNYCWRCHQKMDPLGFPFEQFDDFGRFRLLENLEHPDNLITSAKEADLAFGAKLAVYKTLPVDPRGALKGTDDATLDGDVKDAFELIDRLGASTKVRQSIIRHAFRYFLGRNETLSDSKSLMHAEKAYVQSDGSFDEVIVSLLTSDSFIYRKPVTSESRQ